MVEKRELAKKSRKKDLDDKFLLCDPLPDPQDEKDLTTFITLWREATDKTLREAVDNCQVAENVNKSIDLLLWEAISQYDYEKIRWCQNYIEALRKITLDKYDQISAKILTYIENYTKYTEEDLQKLKKEARSRKVDTTQKAEFTLQESTDDLQFGLWANVSGKSKQF